MSGTITEASTVTCGLRRGDGHLMAVTADGLVLGRTAADPGRLPDPLVSARHARVIHTPHGLQIEDLGSTNGTWVNGQRIVVRLLRDGDILRLGRTLLTAVVPKPGETALPADADSCLWLLARWERLRAHAPGDDYLDRLARDTGVPRRRLAEVRNMRNAIAHADGTLPAQRVASALRLVSEAERALRA
ncbi:FHA domain-containing protein [Herbidospora cretacea]|uniref:FHA domain-containing protein n=1 Tax=Herbidospora cretacea TaxID=28444 RepID=UPI000773530D|nr:FHA domain-containing protein [Herbidospora cretacea]